MDDSILNEQKAYYRARAPEYDDWWRRDGRYDRGDDNARWHAQVTQVEAMMTEFSPTGDVLELACGTGWWSQRLVKTADRLTAVDASPETLELCRERCGDKADYIVADLFDWQPEQQYDVVFFSFWLSHVPEDRFDRFWETVAAALRPGGRVFLVDSLPAPESRASDHAIADVNASTQSRRLNDGREFEIVKIYRTAQMLDARLRETGWQCDLGQTADFFVYGSCRRSP